jgi:[ribosomal protein S5]-alanine N-acetyltransferase
LILFETARLYVRQFTEADLDALYLFSSDPVVMKYIRAPLSVAGTKELLDTQLNGYKQHGHFGRFAVIEKSSRQYIGNFLLRPSETMGGTETGYAFFEHAWGKGYATELTKKALQFAFDNLQIKRVYAITNIFNEASKKVLLKCGFQQLPNFMENDKEVCLFEIVNPTV